MLHEDDRMSILAVVDLTKMPIFLANRLFGNAILGVCSAVKREMRPNRQDGRPY